MMDAGEPGLSLQEVSFLPDELTLITNDEGRFLQELSGQ